MSIFDILTLLGGLAMFLYGMRIMGEGLKEGSGTSLKRAMEKLTNSPVKAFLLGLGITAIIQSSTATIVITSGLVGAGVIKLKQSLGIVIGANVGTTVTGQIIRLLDINSSSTAWLQIFKPSTLAPIALIIGIILIMFIKGKNSDTVGKVAMGFGILFIGLLNMTGSVDSLSESGVFESIFVSLGNNPVLGYISGAGVAFILQSSSATIGILQALSSSGQLTFKAIYAVLVGVYLGDCVTTAIVCYIGAKPDAQRVGIVNILFNICKTLLILIAVAIIHRLGLIESLWNSVMSSGGIANTNTVFNLVSAIVFIPMVNVYERWSYIIVKDDNKSEGRYDSLLSSLSTNFFTSPAIALNSCYDVLVTMLGASKSNIKKAITVLTDYDSNIAEEVLTEEDNIDILADRVGNYLVALSPYIKIEQHATILDEYYKMVTEFERLGDHAVNIVEIAQDIQNKEVAFSSRAKGELQILTDIITHILDYATRAFENVDVDAAKKIEPLEEVVDDLVNALRDNHIDRLRDGKCNIYSGTSFLNLLNDIERISDVCSNIGVATITRAIPELENQAHTYISKLHEGQDEEFNTNYNMAHDEFFERLRMVDEATE